MQHPHPSLEHPREIALYFWRRGGLEWPVDWNRVRRAGDGGATRIQSKLSRLNRKPPNVHFGRQPIQKHHLSFWFYISNHNPFIVTNYFLLCFIGVIFCCFKCNSSITHTNLSSIHASVVAEKLILEPPLANISKIIPWSDKRERVVLPRWPHWPCFHWPLWPLRSSQSCVCLLSCCWHECGGLFSVGNFIPCLSRASLFLAEQSGPLNSHNPDWR